MAMDLQKDDLRALLLKIQPTAGTPVTLSAAADGMLVLNGDYQFLTDELEREADKPGHGARGHVNIKRRSEYKGGIELRGAATVGNAAPCGKILRICGFAETLTAGASAVYGLVSNGFEMATAEGYRDGSKIPGMDIRGAITQIELSIRNFAKAQWTAMGLPAANVVVDAPLPNADYSNFQPPVPIETESFEVDVGGVKLNAISLTVDTQAQVDIYEGSEGRFVFLKQFYRPTATLRVFKEQRSVFHPEQIALAHTVQNLYAEIVGGGETVRMDLTGVQLGVAKMTSHEGLSAWDIPVKVQGTTPTNCLALSFLEAP